MSCAAADDDNVAAVLAELRGQGLDLDGFSDLVQAQAVRRRMRELGIDSVAEYQSYVAANPGEGSGLSQCVFLNYTAFLREPAAAWQFLAQRVVPVVRAQAGDRAVRAWSAGCASGEEAYSIAMVLMEGGRRGASGWSRGVGGARRGGASGAPGGAHVFATDIDDTMLGVARDGRYDAAAAAKVPQSWRRRYLRRDGSAIQIGAQLSAAVTFLHHDLSADPPLLDMDIIVCRHTLMYLSPADQARVLGGFARVLRPGGVLFVESTDRLLGAEELFVACGAGLPLFRRAGS